MPFIPDKGATVNIDVSSSSQNVKLYADGGPVDVRVVNNGSATVWIDFGDATVAATLTGSMPIQSGKDAELLHAANPGSGPLYVAAIAAASTGKIYFTTGRDR